MTEGDIDEDYLDDPIRLFDSEQNRVCFHLIRKEVIIEDSDDVDETEIEEPQTEHKKTLYSYESNSSILPITFFDIDTNVELLKRCRPLSIKLIDCDKYSWYSKKNTVLTKHNSLNSDKIVLQEADCIEILSSDETNDNENYDMILKRNTLEDISNINKELNRMRIESETKSMAKNTAQEKEMPEEYKKNSLKNDNNIDLKRNKGVIGLKISQANFMINSQSDKTCVKNHICDLINFEDTYVDKINTYARIIDKTYQKLQNINKPPRTIDKYSGQNYEKDQNIDKSKPAENSETTKLNDIRKNNINDSTKITRLNINYDLLFSKLSQSKNTVAQIFLKNNEDMLVSEKSSYKSEHLIPDKNKVTNVIIEEPHSKGTTLDNNNGSTSPLLPCPSQPNKTSNPKKVTIISDTLFSSNSKQNVKNNNVCKNHLFSANRVIPHYHNESMQITKKYIPSKVSQKNAKESIEKNKVLQTHHEHVACNVNDFNYNNQSVSKECNNDKQNRLTNVNVDGINNFTYNIHSKSNINQIPQLNRSMPNLSTEQRISQPNLNQKLIENNINVSKKRSRQSEVTISSSEETKRSNSHPITVINNIPVKLSRKPQCTHQNNVNRPTFPIQRIVSDRDNVQTNKFVVTSEHPTAMSTIRQQIQNMHQHNIYPNHINNNFHTTENSSCSRTFLQTPANCYGHRSPTLLTMTQQLLSTLTHLPQHQVNPLVIPNINLKHHISNYEYPTSVEDMNKHRILLGDKSSYKDSYVNQSKKSEENIKSNERKASAYVNKHPNLKQTLEQPPLKMSKPDVKNKIKDQRICQNNNCMKIKCQNDINDNTNKNTILLNNTNTFNANKEAMVVALLATDYVNQKVSRMEENIKYKGSKEASLRIDKNTRLTQSVVPLPLETSKPDSKITENNPKIDQNNIISVKNVSKGYSPPVLPITTYQKTFEILAKIKLYDLDKKSNQPDANNIIGASVSQQNGRKRKIGETKQKITISEYKKRKSAMETINVEDYEVNVV